MRPETTFTGPDLCARPAREVVADLAAGHLDPSDVLDACAARMDQVEGDVNAVVTRCVDRAREAIGGLPERARTNGGAAGWLAGLPVAIKDLNAVKGVRTTFANTWYADFVPEASDPLVERLEARGALVVGKTNTPEFGAGGNSTNAVFGSTRNPWDTRMNAGGSSGGAAAALAAGEVWLAHGSDLMGSLRTPAAHCSVLGLRPSPGRCGGGPGTAKFLTEGLQGPMARDTRDLALFLDAMTGWDPRMPLSLDAPATPYVKAIEEAPRPPRIAFSEDQNGFAAVETEIRAKLARIGVGPGKSFQFKDLPLAHRLEIALGMRDGEKKLKEYLGGELFKVNGWSVSDLWGDASFFDGDWIKRAAGASAGIYGNDALEAVYILGRNLANGEELDGSKQDYTLTFPVGELPPVNAFWSVTMYDGKTQLLIENPINRYLINTALLPSMKKNADGSLTLYIQKDSPGAEKESNWLPAPDGPIYLAMRMYWPKTGQPSVLPVGQGAWQPPALEVAK
mgnify:CR=1 FL=1